MPGVVCRNKHNNIMHAVEKYIHIARVIVYIRAVIAVVTITVVMAL